MVPRGDRVQECKWELSSSFVFHQNFVSIIFQAKIFFSPHFNHSSNSNFNIVNRFSGQRTAPNTRSTFDETRWKNLTSVERFAQIPENRSVCFSSSQSYGGCIYNYSAGVLVGKSVLVQEKCV
jgi:hypothetical protein